MKNLGILLFPNFELLDVCGPAEMFGVVPEHFKLVTVAQQRGLVASTQGIEVMAQYSTEDCPALDILMVPGGMGTRTEVDNRTLLSWLAERSAQVQLILSVCTGALLLAKAGLLDNRNATSNKRAWELTAIHGPDVRWVTEARWVDDGNLVTSSGVSAGIDMALHVIERYAGEAVAEKVANRTEYKWNRDPNWDPFAMINGLT
jgi:transcriptional regulator GlxA family with amidase domain